jgi:hypothetical protein
MVVVKVAWYSTAGSVSASFSPIVEKCSLNNSGHINVY